MSRGHEADQRQGSDVEDLTKTAEEIISQHC